MIDPANITNFNRSQNELEEFAIFAVLVAGKTAKTTAARLEKFLQPNINRPMSFILSFDCMALPIALKNAGIGCYNQKARTLRDLAYAVKYQSLDLSTASPEDLEQIRGIGLKTSRFFIMHSRPNARVAALDTHILKGLATWHRDVPTITPSSPKIYRLWEERFLHIADFFSINPADLDLSWWNYYSGHTVDKPVGL